MADGRTPRRWLLMDGYARHPGDVVRLVIGGIIVMLTAFAIHTRRVGLWETAVFRVVNDLPLPGFTYPAVWLAMQLGVIGAVPVVVVLALATVASPYLPRRSRRIAWGLAITVCLARMYVGAHLPLDVVGGAALGWMAGALVHLVLGTPEPRPSVKKIAKVLDAHGFDPAGLAPAGRGEHRSTRFATDALFVKAVVREWRDTDLLYRAWRWLRGPTVRTRRRGNPEYEVGHEATMALMAAAAGVRTPRVLLVQRFGNGAGLLVQARVAGRALAELPPEERTAGLLAEIRRQVRILHEARIAHGDLDATNIVVDGDGNPWLVDFDQASPAAGDRLLERDQDELRTALGPASPPERSTAPAH
jgi:predicted Ser/Thr protein kinase